VYCDFELPEFVDRVTLRVDELLPDDLFTLLDLLTCFEFGLLLV